MNPVADFRRGWRAPFGTMLSGAALALPVSVPFALIAGQVLGDRGGLPVLLSGLVQFFLTFWFAGLLLRRRH